MKFKELLHEFQRFFENDGIADDSYEEQKPKMTQAIKHLHAMLLQGLTPEQNNAIRCSQEIAVSEDQPEKRCLQQLHFFIKDLRLEKTVWSNLFRFINFPLQNTVPRDQRWTEPKQKLKIKKRQLITSYADSLLFLLDDKEHIILPKLQDIERIERKEAALELKIKQFKYVIENMHDEAFCAKHYHFIRPWMSKKDLLRDEFNADKKQPLQWFEQHTTQAKETTPMCLEGT
mgnify:CR=1 FL=1